ncbi:cell wall hydrolase [Lachnoclostridium sp. Marseille-P6806]|uniref:cell wall hydrolase n=1 Tax=Lachnoclostridium sp. Marseille-P6806 TaxID=2364793 RepID=UPI001031A9FF|nr:cell wall hydrolase [Lachnoclostridium sp. Marseille-P6806]
MRGRAGRITAAIMAGIVFFSSAGVNTLAAGTEMTMMTADAAQALAGEAAGRAAAAQMEAELAQKEAEKLGAEAQTAAETVQEAQRLFLSDSIDTEMLAAVQNVALNVVTDAAAAAADAVEKSAAADAAAAAAEAAGRAAEKRLKEEAAASRRQKIMDSITEEDVRLLGALIFYEANTESYEGKVAVGNVVINRMLSTRFPDAMQAVIMQSGQFLPARLCASLVARGGVPESCMEAAREAVSGARPVGDAVFFCQARISGGQVIGAHCFYGF